MKITKYLVTEAKSYDLPSKIEVKEEDYETIKEVVDTLKTHCGPFLQDIKKVGRLLYRGTYKVDWREPMQHTQVRMDRRPKDTNLILHNYTDDYLEKKFGWRPRGQGVFTTGNRGQAVSYGNLFSVWPVGDYKYLWSDDVRDLFNNFRTALQLSSGEMKSAAKVHRALQDDDNGKRKIQKLLNTFQDTNLRKAVVSGNEVILGCKSYYLVNAHHNKYVSSRDMEDLSVLIEMMFENKKFFIEDPEGMPYTGKEVKFDV
jgi:hypothetical protein